MTEKVAVWYLEDGSIVLGTPLSFHPGSSFLTRVISGFNTDIEFDGTVYHVQTEDKGTSSGVIMTLVYDRGTILASKRSSYDDLAGDGFDEAKLAERVQKQHKLICAAVSAGRIDELKEMTAKSAGRVSRPKAVPVETMPVPVIIPDPVSSAASNGHNGISSATSRTADKQISHSSISMPGVGEMVIDAIEVVDDEIELLPEDAVTVVTEFSGQERPKNEKLSLELLSESKFKGGDRKTVNIMLCRGTARKVVGRAQILIKVLGSSFRPVIFHASTDHNGIAKVHLQLPHFQAGRAALLVRAMTDGEEVELRRIVTPG